MAHAGLRPAPAARGPSRAALLAAAAVAAALLPAPTAALWPDGLHGMEASLFEAMVLDAPAFQTAQEAYARVHGLISHADTVINDRLIGVQRDWDDQASHIFELEARQEEKLAAAEHAMETLVAEVRSIMLGRRASFVWPYVLLGALLAGLAVQFGFLTRGVKRAAKAGALPGGGSYGGFGSGGGGAGSNPWV